MNTEPRSITGQLLYAGQLVTFTRKGGAKLMLGIIHHFTKTGATVLRLLPCAPHPERGMEPYLSSFPDSGVPLFDIMPLDIDQIDIDGFARIHNTDAATAFDLVVMISAKMIEVVLEARE